jgi:uncharacterized protein YodC (DUF2158 family)
MLQVDKLTKVCVIAIENNYLTTKLRIMNNSFEIGDVVAFKANKNIQLVVTGIGADGIVLLRYFDTNTNDFKKVEIPAICFIKIE